MTFSGSIHPGGAGESGDGDGEGNGSAPLGSDSLPFGDHDASTRILAAVANATKDAVVVTSTEGFVVEWNPAAEDIYGYARHEALGQHVQVLYESQSLPLLHSLLETVIRLGDANFEKTVVRKDGSLIQVTGTISVIRDDTAKVVAFVGISRELPKA